MAETHTFYPPRNLGIVLHVFLILILLTGCGALFYLAFANSQGIFLVLYLLGGLVLLALLPIAGYRGYALLHASYSLERDGFRVHWGLRSEDIPLTEVIWVGLVSDLEHPIKTPNFSIPGAILGSVNHQELGTVDFMASAFSNLVAISTVNKAIVVSPENVEEFLHRFERAIEMGSLTPIDSHSIVPAAYIQQVLSDKVARFSILASLAMTVCLVLAAGLFLQGEQTISLGFDAFGKPLPPVPASRILLLPVIGAIFFLFNLIAGLFFYRREESRPVARLVWASGVVTPVLLLVAVFVVFL